MTATSWPTYRLTLPLLVGAAVAGPQLQQRAVGRTGVGDVQALKLPRCRDLGVGLELLRDALRDLSSDLDEACDQVLQKVKPSSAADDIVLLLARTRTLDARRVRTWQLPLDPATVAEARLWAARQLTAWGLSDLASATELIVSELVTNAIRYGSAPVQLRLIRGSALVCEVSDGNSSAPHLRRARVFDEGGRGLMLVAQVAERWGSRQTPAGKTIWAEQPLPTAHG